MPSPDGMEGLDETTAWLWRRGRIYRRAGQLPRAELMLLLASQLAPGQPAILRELARVFLATGQAGRCLACLDLVATKEPLGMADIRMRCGSLHRLGRAEDAYRQLQDAVNREHG
jgi:type III secretion protein Y